MQKKVLFSLLMTGPVGLSAYADINLPDFTKVTGNNAWTPNGASSELNIGTDANPSISATAAIGFITKSYKVPQGTYQIAFSNPKNITVSVDGKALKLSAENTADFTVASEKTIEVKVAATDPSLGFSFDKCDLSIVFNFDKEADLLTEYLGTIGLVEPTNPCKYSFKSVPVSHSKMGHPREYAKLIKGD